MNHKEKAIWFMSVYNQQYEDYKLQAARPGLTDDEKDVLRAKKDILKKVYPLIEAYNSFIETGSIPPVKTEALIMQLIVELSNQP